jgi:hypothetical protein
MAIPAFFLSRTAVVLIAVGAIASLDLSRRLRHQPAHYVFATLFGTLLSTGLISFANALLTPSVETNAPVMGLGILLIILGWHLLFGAWEASTKATVLGTFVFWIAMQMLLKEAPEERTAHALAIATAAVPAVIWCLLFLSYHAERLSIVLLMFFAGMISTIPILFYDALVRHGVELQFFFLRIIPENFGKSAQTFVHGQFPDLHSLQATLLTLLVSFLLVGMIEEASKLWVLRRNGKAFFTSIDDVLEFSIIVAIGFAFAENVTNSGYFLSFVKEYLLSPDHADWTNFFGNVVGRSILTSMVHIVSTGVMGYFLGRAIFAAPLIEEARVRGDGISLSGRIARLFSLREESVFRTGMVTVGFLLATFLHALSNFMVTLPDALPGNPRTLGDLLHAAPGSFLHYFALLLFPALLYVVGGFWLLTELFARQENSKERGHILTVDKFVTGHDRV